MKDNKLVYWLIGIFITLLVQTVVVTSYIVTNRNQANINTRDINANTTKIDKAEKRHNEFIEKVYDKLEKIHRNMPSD